MINAILTGIISLVMALVELMLYPINFIISTFLPDLDNALYYVANMFELAGQCVGFCVSMLGLSSFAVSIIVLFWVFKLTAPFAINSIKLAINWYRSLKL